MAVGAICNLCRVLGSMLGSPLGSMLGSMLASPLGSLTIYEYNLLSGVCGEIDLIRIEFEQMNAFLQKAGATENDDPQFEAWVKQVRDTAYDAGDVLEEFMLRLEYNRSDSQLYNKTFGFMKTIIVRHQIASEVQRIKSKMSAISESKKKYNHLNIEASSSNNDSTNTRHDIRQDALLLEENNIVGITKPKSDLIKLLVDEKKHELQVVSVYGMGGLGKTTLVKKVFDEVKNAKKFEAHAWITVSKLLQIEELLKGMIKELFDELKIQVPDEVEQKDQNQLKRYIADFLQSKRYVIVLDDVWSTKEWNALKLVFPDNNLSSRVILTTRELRVASFGNVYRLSPLSEEESWTLFCKKAFEGKSCPQDLKEITKAILKKCAGLPLAVVAIGGLLANKEDQTIDEWNTTYRGLGAELGKEGNLTDVDKVLSISYFDLPWYLKLCFLYLSIFPEDYPINKWLLIRLWIAEGFVQSMPGLTPEEVAGRYLRKLLHRSLIMVATLRDDGRAKRYQVHDIWRELILSRSIKQDLVTTFGAQQNCFPLKVRRLSIHNEMGNWQVMKNRVTHVHSLLIFGSRDSEFTMSIMDSLGNGARLVKVLDLRQSGLLTFPPQIGKLLHLKYLSLRGTRIEEVPKSIGDLKMLETLDLKNTEVRELPNEILKLHQLRHLLVGSIDRGFKALEGIENLSCLQKLCSIELNISGSDAIVRNLENLTELRKIIILQIKNRDVKVLCITLQKLTELRSLRITVTDEDKIIHLEPFLSPPKHLQTLGITARMKKLPQWIPSLQNLAKLDLCYSKFKEDPLLQLQDMPNLTFLKLNDAYEGAALSFQAGTFKKLTVLELISLDRLYRVRVMKGAMPRLKKLHFCFCPLIEELPSGIETLSCLAELELFDMSEKLVSKLKRDEQNLNFANILHIPTVWIRGFRNRIPYSLKL